MSDEHGTVTRRCALSRLLIVGRRRGRGRGRVDGCRGWVGVGVESKAGGDEVEEGGLGLGFGGGGLGFEGGGLGVTAVCL